MHFFAKYQLFLLFNLKKASDLLIYNLLIRSRSDSEPYCYETRNIAMNERYIDDDFDLETPQLIIRHSLNPIKTNGSFDTICAAAIGVSDQIGVTHRGLSHALLTFHVKFYHVLKNAEFLTCNPKTKEYKKYELKGTRRIPPFSRDKLFALMQNSLYISACYLLPFLPVTVFSFVSSLKPHRIWTSAAETLISLPSQTAIMVCCTSVRYTAVP